MNYVQYIIQLIEEFLFLSYSIISEAFILQMHLKLVLLRTYFEFIKNNFIKPCGSYTTYPFSK